VGRLVPTLLVVALLAGTTAAFAITEGLKLERTPITAPDIDRVFSPLSERHPRAEIGFRLRKADRITVSIVDDDGETVRTIMRDVARRRGRVQLVWDGRDAAGRLVPEGEYRPQVRLDRQHRTILIPNAIEVDLTPPEATLGRVRPRRFSPDRDGRREVVRVRFRVDEAARPWLLVKGRRVIRGKLEPRGGIVSWFGKAGGRILPAGTYALSLRAEDRAGNVSAPTPSVQVEIRYVELDGDVFRARAGRRFAARVLTDAENVNWRLGGRTGVVEAKRLRLRAPRRPGRYTLYVSANGHADSATVVVRRRP
jgi:hypothetical protein